MKTEMVGIVKKEGGEFLGGKWLAGVISGPGGQVFEIPVPNEFHREVVGFRQVMRNVKNKKLKITIETID